MVHIPSMIVKSWILIAGVTQAAPAGLSGLSLRQDAEPASCTDEVRLIRREWGDISSEERLAFISSVQCLMELPSRIPEGLAPGSRSNYDDFIATHINRTLNVHTNGVFPTFHREFIYIFENALRTECGYQYALPYVDWTKWASDLASSPIFDGSETSLGGNGIFDANRTAAIIPGTTTTLENGDGGGCVVTGPFANLTLSFQVFPQITDFGNLPVLEDPLGHYPHCLTRDLNNAIARASYSTSKIDNIISAPDFINMVTELDASGVDGNNDIGVHGGGHYSAGPDMWDFWASPSDPTFWLHHGFVDKIYADWQSGDPDTRVNAESAIAGTDALFNDGSGTAATLDYVIDMGFLARGKPIRDIVDISGGDYCYRYE
ncbi:hypothetical protein C7974DRAFT_329331 [Boeremia exigua]|uniref:uncharacterized protein n=1 Tax=Boeremia exigua TaxID=749465 RepID=UPI001E8D0211|nr:uncharacterized protein C7974DRAFT_329331 [Boeremia exigua]KAH6638727.1 hypothetical protein C7974DRAFT_329331 [Boeremia exigua]